MCDKIYFSKVRPDAIIPSKKAENAGYDIYACFDDEYIEIMPHETKMIPTGIASAFSIKFYMQLEERGSTGTQGIGQRCGVIDSGFRKEWFVPITNHNVKPLLITKNGDAYKQYESAIKENKECSHIVYPYAKAICQAVLLPVPEVDVVEVDYNTLKTFESERGMGCLGSSGK